MSDDLSRFRRLHKLYADALGYFWARCPLCRRYSGGHEWKDRNGLPSVIPVPNRPGVSRGICPDCTRAGYGHREWNVTL